MEWGKLTAKLRDAVPVCFIVNGMEVKRLKNIEIPDEIKKLPFTAFKFDVPQNGAITFKIMFEAGILPDVWPEARQRKSRATQAMRLPNNISSETSAMLAASVRNGGYADLNTIAEEAESESAEPETMDVHYDCEGENRKQLVKSIGEYTGNAPVYQNAPTFAYCIGEYRVDKKGTLTGPYNKGLIEWLCNEGFQET